MFLEEAGKPLSGYERPDEHASHILEALETGRTYRGHFNVKNNVIIKNLPTDYIVESPDYVDRFGLNMVEGVTLTDACAATCNISVSMQRMGMKAAISGDVELLKQAILHDPLVGAICTPQEVWQMVDELLVAQAQVAAICPCHPSRRRAAENPKSQNPRLGGGSAAESALGRRIARRRQEETACRGSWFGHQGDGVSLKLA